MTQHNKLVTKLDLAIPELQILKFKILPLPVFTDKTGKEIDFTKDIKAEEIDKKMVLKVGEFKTFYDNLLQGFTEYDRSINSNHINIKSSLSSIMETIGNQKEEINSMINQLREDMPYFSPTQAEDIL